MFLQILTEAAQGPFPVRTLFLRHGDVVEIVEHHRRKPAWLRAYVRAFLRDAACPALVPTV